MKMMNNHLFFDIIKMVSMMKNSSVIDSQSFDVKKNDLSNITEELKDIYEGKYKRNEDRCLIGNLTYKDITSKDEWVIDEPLSEEEIKYLSFSKNDASFKFEKYDDFDNIFKIINELDKLDKKNTFTIRVQKEKDYDNKNKFNEYLFRHIDLFDKDITIMVGINEEYSLKDYVTYEKRLIEMVRPAFNLSPFEKYLFAYNIVKNYKEYKENEESKNESRYLYKVLDGDYIVCVGYATLLCDLLSKLGIESRHYGVSIEVGLDEVANDALVLPDDVVTKDAAHARIEVNLVDPKYGIDGIYLADPTWDNDLEHDTYNYALMTQDEYNGIKRYNYLFFHNVNELFFVHSLDEFYQKVNIWMNKKISREMSRKRKSFTKKLDALKSSVEDFLELVQKKKPEIFEKYKKNITFLTKHIGTKDSKSIIVSIENEINNFKDDDIKKSFNGVKEKYNSCCYFRKDIYEEPNEVNKKIIINLIDSIKFTDSKKHAELLAKYSEIEEYHFYPTVDYLQKFLLEFGEYLLNKVNKPVTGEQFKTAITEVYRASGIDGDVLTAKVDEVMKYNKERQQKAFPTRYSVLDDGTRIPVMNATNKFDLEESRKKIG